MYTYIYSVFNNAVNNSNYTASNDWVEVNNELKIM
jgi:hypothetical protein